MLPSLDQTSRSPTPLRPRRAPRPDEIALLQALAGGARAVTAGPIGRCVKRGWARALVRGTAEGPGDRAAVTFALTDAGRALIAEAADP